jgi:PEP-CTERM motif
MTRILLLATVLAARLCAGTISTSSPCPVTSFTVGHMTVSNCQVSVTYTSTATEGPGPPLLQIGNLGLVPLGIPGYCDNCISEPGSISLSTGPEADFVDAFVTADFTMDPQWRIKSLSLIFNEDDDSFVTGGVLLNSPCVANFFRTGPSAGGGSCLTSPLLQSGTISLKLYIQTDLPTVTWEGGTGIVGPGHLDVLQVFVPEPSTVVLIGLGIAVCLFSCHSTRLNGGSGAS